MKQYNRYDAGGSDRVLVAEELARCSEGREDRAAAVSRLTSSRFLGGDEEGVTGGDAVGLCASNEENDFPRMLQRFFVSFAGEASAEVASGWGPN